MSQTRFPQAGPEESGIWVSASTFSNVATDDRGFFNICSISLIFLFYESFEKKCLQNLIKLVVNHNNSLAFGVHFVLLQFQFWLQSLCMSSCVRMCVVDVHLHACVHALCVCVWYVHVCLRGVCERFAHPLACLSPLVPARTWAHDWAHVWTVVALGCTTSPSARWNDAARLPHRDTVHPAPPPQDGEGPGGMEDRWVELHREGHDGEGGPLERRHPCQQQGIVLPWFAKRILQLQNPQKILQVCGGGHPPQMLLGKKTKTARRGGKPACRSKP